MLDEFSSTKLDSSAPSAPSPLDAVASAPPLPSQPEAPAFSDHDDFAKQLQAGMAEMLRELESNPAMAKQFEALMAQVGGPGMGASMEGSPDLGLPLSAAAAQTQPPLQQEQEPRLKAQQQRQQQQQQPATRASAASKPAPSAFGPSVPPSAPPSTDDAFQETIKRTMSRMKASASSADAAAASGTSALDDDIMASLLKELQSGAAGGGDGGDGEDNFSKVLLGMMEQLTNKEILYEPMKELSVKFPGWFAEHEKPGNKTALLSADEVQRYREQQRLVGEIVARFERKGYSDDNAADREYIVERMQQVCAYSSLLVRD